MGRRLIIYIAIFFTIAIAVGSLISIKNIAEPKIHNLDKIIHFGAYGVLALSWLLSFKKNIESKKYASLTAFVVFVYGIIIEVLQGTLTSYRQVDFYDILANFAGITIALLVFSMVFQKKQLN